MEINQDLYHAISNIPNKKRHQYFRLTDRLGKGASGSVYLVDTDLTYIPLVAKKPHTRHTSNEVSAHLFIRDKMLSEELPHYFPMLYANYTHNCKKYLIMELCDESVFDDYFVEEQRSTLEFLEIFYQIADAVDALEQIEMNHGDLWTDNVMIWYTGSKPKVCIIDFDCTFKKGVCENPALGYGNDYRKDFFIGYDLSRLFDDIKHSYDNYKLKRTVCKNKYTKRILKQQQKGQCLEIDPYASDSETKEYDEVNIKFTPDIIEFIYSLELSDPSEPTQAPHMSGASIKQRIIEFAKKKNIECTSFL